MELFPRELGGSPEGRVSDAAWCFSHKGPGYILFTPSLACRLRKAAELQGDFPAGRRLQEVGGMQTRKPEAPFPALSGILRKGLAFFLSKRALGSGKTELVGIFQNRG